MLTTLRWGLIPSWAKERSIGNRMINARMETLVDKPAFRRAFAARRCLLPADGYYEWYATDRVGKGGKPIKQPFFIRSSSGGRLAMAGLYEIWRDRSKPEDDLGHIHSRMPLLVEPERWARWLDPELSDSDELLGLLVPAAPGRLEAYPVSTEVNNVANNGAELVQPLPVEDPSQ